MLAQQINKYLLCERHKYLRSGGEIRFKNIASALLAIKNDGGFAWRNLFFYDSTRSGVATKKRIMKILPKRTWH